MPAGFPQSIGGGAVWRNGEGEEVELPSENQSTYIPIGKQYRLANPGKIPAFLSEVPSGPYLDEDDIVCFDDIHRRSSTE